MKISDRTHPIIDIINGGAFNNIIAGENRRILANGAFDYMLKQYPIGRVQILSEEFYNAAFKNKGKIATSDNVNALFDDVEEENISIVKKNPDFKAGEQVDFDKTKNAVLCLPNKVSYIYHIWSRESFIIIGFKDRNLDYFQHSTGAQEKCFVYDQIGGKIFNENEHVYIPSELFVPLLFIKYADIEIKVLSPKTKKRETECKYINDTNKSIEIIDCRWYTTLVKNDPFLVRGHLRLQPYGEGFSKRKFIWIKEYKKSGYTAHARKLSIEA